MLNGILVLPGITDDTKAAITKAQTDLDSAGDDQDAIKRIARDVVETILKDPNVPDPMRNVLNNLLGGIGGPDNAMTTTSSPCKLLVCFPFQEVIVL